MVAVKDALVNIGCKNVIVDDLSVIKDQSLGSLLLDLHTESAKRTLRKAIVDKIGAFSPNEPADALLARLAFKGITGIQ
jgi:hypothetical protein